MHHVRQVFVAEKFRLAVPHVSQHLARPILPAALEAQILVEAPFARLERDLIPLAHRRRDVARRLQHPRQHDLVAAHLVRVAIRQHSRAENVAPRETRRARRPAHRIRVAIFKARPALCECVNVRRFESAAVTTDVPQPDVVGEDEDDVRLRCAFRGGGLAAKEREERKDEKRFGIHGFAVFSADAPRVSLDS